MAQTKNPWRNDARGKALRGAIQRAARLDAGAFAGMLTMIEAAVPGLPETGTLEPIPSE